MFEVGEIINPEHWGLRLQITSVEPLEGVIIQNEAPASYVGKFFPVGMKLRFKRVGPGIDSWNIDTEDKDMPWYGLCIFQGRKSFAHYR